MLLSKNDEKAIEKDQKRTFPELGARGAYLLVWGLQARRTEALPYEVMVIDIFELSNYLMEKTKSFKGKSRGSAGTRDVIDISTFCPQINEDDNFSLWEHFDGLNKNQLEEFKEKIGRVLTGTYTLCMDVEQDYEDNKQIVAFSCKSLPEIKHDMMKAMGEWIFWNKDILRC